MIREQETKAFTSQRWRVSSLNGDRKGQAREALKVQKREDNQFSKSIRKGGDPE